MKKILLLMALCTFYFSSIALPPQVVYNLTINCDVKITAFCYTSPGCTPIQNLGSITLGAGTSSALPTGTCVTPGALIGYKVCCPNGTTCTVVNDGGTVVCSNIGNNGLLNCSADCALKVYWSATGLQIDHQ